MNIQLWQLSRAILIEQTEIPFMLNQPELNQFQVGRVGRCARHEEVWQCCQTLFTNCVQSELQKSVWRILVAKTRDGIRKQTEVKRKYVIAAQQNLFMSFIFSVNSNSQSKVNCCVVGCTIAYYNTPGIKCYTFPGKSYMKKSEH